MDSMQESEIDEKTNKRRVQNSAAAKRHRAKRRRDLLEMKSENDWLRSQQARQHVLIKRMLARCEELNIPKPEFPRMEDLEEHPLSQRNRALGLDVRTGSSATPASGGGKLSEDNVAVREIYNVESRLMNWIDVVKTSILKTLLEEIKGIESVVDSTPAPVTAALK